MNLAIAGAGLAGRLLALKLSQLGYQVTLFDIDNINGHASCGYIAGGMLAPLAELEHAEQLIYDLGMQSIPLWDKWLTELNATDLLQKKGTIIISHKQDVTELLHFIAILSKKTNHSSDIISLDKLALKQLEPEITIKNNQAYHLPNEGSINTEGLYQLLEKKLNEYNVAWYSHHCVEQVNPGEIVTTQKKYHFDWVFDCRGLGAKKQLTTLRGVRGEIIHLSAPEVNITRPVRLLHPRYSIYIVPRPNHQYVIGASSIESEDYSPISVRTNLELLSAAYSVHSGFAEARVIKTATNCRPAFPDNHPKVIYQQRLTCINGLYRHGYLIAPALVNEVVQRFSNKNSEIL